MNHALKLIIYVILFVVSASTVNAGQFATETPDNIGKPIAFKASELCQVATNTKKYLDNHLDDDYAVHSGKVFSDSVTLNRVKSTLSFICQTYRDDVRNNRPSRLHDIQFLTEHFEFIRWSPDLVKAHALAATSTNKVKAKLLNAIPPQQLLLTKYYTKLLDGSTEKTLHYSQALYQLPKDELNMSLEQAQTKQSELTRFKFTRQQVIAGALDAAGLASPLVWVSEEALHDVLLQGTGVLNVAGQTRYFNVHRNNGINYDYSIGKRDQARYWYFAEVDSILGYGKELSDKIPVIPQVTLAGNVKQLGLGKLFMLSYPVNGKQQARLAVLADEGGAFDDNLFQLDLLVGSYRDWDDYYLANKHLPDYATVWLMLVKQP